MADLTLLANVNLDMIKAAVFIALAVIWGLSHIIKHLQESAEDKRRREAIAQRRQQQQPTPNRAAPEVVAIPGGGANELEKFLTAMQSAAPSPPPIPEPARPRVNPPKRPKQQAKAKERSRATATPTSSTPMTQRHLQSQLGTLHSVLDNKHVGGNLAASRRTLTAAQVAAEPGPVTNLTGLLNEKTIAQTLIAGEIFGPPLALRGGAAHRF